MVYTSVKKGNETVLSRGITKDIIFKKSSFGDDFNLLANAEKIIYHIGS
jgi:hypothetical protein